VQDVLRKTNKFFVNGKGYERAFVAFYINFIITKENKIMFKYYVNKQTTGNPNYNHEVHAEYCRYLPTAENSVYLGVFTSCSDAVKKAKTIYSNVDGCATCCPSCHKQ